MKISYNWLKQFINLDWEAEKTGNLLTDLGLEVEGIESFESVKGSLKGIVVGEVLTCIKHPDADRLKLTTVNLGSGEPVQIVCGAPNVAAGQKVPVATIGTTLYDTKGEAWTIKKGKIRGQESHGMICAEDELGLGESHDGILVLAEDLEAGTLLADILSIESDQVFEIGLTPNRADAMSHMGVARDLKAGLLHQKINPGFITPSTTAFHIENRTNKINVEVHNNELAPRYCGVTISGITVKESPSWIQNRLKAIGLTPINNIVDVTNYVLHELGQPLHAFDFAKISGGEINVKCVKKGTKFTTLDEVERELHEEDLMICDAEKPLCIAGVFGGINSGVSQTTHAIFLESAYFNPISIRKTAKRHALNTDASFRFERGIDPNITEYALKRAAILIVETAGGHISSEITDIYPKKVTDHQVFLQFDHADALIGEKIEPETIKGILSSLDIKINNVTESGIGMTIPAYRNDVNREVDVIEEILRVYGYNNVAFSGKLNASIATTNRFEDHKIQRIIGDQLASLGFNEIMTNSLTTPNYAAQIASLKEDYNVEMLNPLSNDLSVMRQTLLFSGLEAISHNINRKRENLSLFEFGKTYHNFPGGSEEQKCLTLYLTGSRNSESWLHTSAPSSFFQLKGIVYSILERLGIANLTEKPTKNLIFSEGLQLVSQKKTLIEFGVVKKQLNKVLQINQEVLYAEFNWDLILNVIKNQKILFKAIPKYPAVRRDLALLLDQEITFSQLYDMAFQAEKKLLKEVSLFDVYLGKNIPEGKKSYALSFTLLDENNTLTDKQIDKVMDKIQSSFKNQLKAELR